MRSVSKRGESNALICAMIVNDIKLYFKILEYFNDEHSTQNF